jgi:hypothetical protein
MFFKKLLIAEGVIPLLLKLFNSSITEVKEQVRFSLFQRHLICNTITSINECIQYPQYTHIWLFGVNGLNNYKWLVELQAILCLGVIAANNPECRDFILQNGALSSLLSLIHIQTPLPILRKLSWTLSILCGVTHPSDKLPAWEWVSSHTHTHTHTLSLSLSLILTLLTSFILNIHKVIKHCILIELIQIQPALHHLGTLLFCEDEEVVVNVLAALALVLPGLPEPNICNRLVSLLKFGLRQPNSPTERWLFVISLLLFTLFSLSLSILIFRYYP